MPDAKSLLPGRAFRSEHAQLRPEPHSIASHGPAPMDPLQTTRMRNGVLYAAEWPCCHDPLRLSLGSEDPFYQTTHAFGARGCATPPPLFGCGGGRARRARRVRAPPPRAGRRAPNAQAPFPLPSLNPAARALPRARARGVALAAWVSDMAVGGGLSNEGGRWILCRLLFYSLTGDTYDLAVFAHSLAHVRTLVRATL